MLDTPQTAEGVLLKVAAQVGLYTLRAQNAINIDLFAMSYQVALVGLRVAQFVEQTAY